MVYYQGTRYVLLIIKYLNVKKNGKLSERNRKRLLRFPD